MSMDCPVASNGDITLIVGPDKMRICVQSAILSISSKPFAAMLSPTWKAPDVKTVDLPDDDAEAMLEICHALHKNYDKLQTRPTPETLLEIAILADKYFLLSPLASIAKRFWLVGKDHPRPYTIKSDGFLGMMQATAAAKMFDACVFATYTGELVCHWGLSYVIGSPGCADLFMTESLSKGLEWQRNFLINRLAQMFTHDLYPGLLPGLANWSREHYAACWRTLFDSGIDIVICLATFERVQEIVIAAELEFFESGCERLYGNHDVHIYGRPTTRYINRDIWEQNCRLEAKVIILQSGMCLRLLCDECYRDFLY